MTGQVAARTSGGHLPSGTTACVGAFCVCADNGLLDDEAPEPQQTLFSWAQFMAEEPANHKGRGHKPPPSALSLFEWAFSLE